MHTEGLCLHRFDVFKPTSKFAPVNSFGGQSVFQGWGFVAACTD